MFAARQGEQKVKEGSGTQHIAVQHLAGILNLNRRLLLSDCQYSVGSYDKEPREVAFPRRREMSYFCMPVSCQSSRQTGLWPFRTTQFMFLCRSLCDPSVIPRRETGTCYFPWKTWEMRENNSWGLCSVGKVPLLRAVLLHVCSVGQQPPPHPEISSKSKGTHFSLGLLSQPQSRGCVAGIVFLAALEFCCAKLGRVLLVGFQMERSISLFPWRNKVDLVAQGVIPATQKAEAGESQVQGQPGKHSEPLSQNKRSTEA